MSLFDNMKQSYEKRQEQNTARNNLRGKKITGLLAEYIGGYDQYQKASGTLSFYEKRLEFSVALMKAKSFEIENSQVSDIAVEGRDEVHSRVTVTRLLTVGILAFALKKKKEDKEAFITVVLNDGQEAVFHVKGKSPLQLKPSLANAISIIKSAK